MAKIITFGEMMLRLSPQGYKRFVQSDVFEVNYGGGEANVAVSLAQFGHQSFFVTKIPAHEIGQSAVNYLKRYGVKTDFISRGGQRLGVYFLEHGASMRPSKVIYDRQYSAISEATVKDFDFESIFKDADWFHFTGITPALSDQAKALIKVACEQAKKYHVLVSVDLNYRKKLWSREEAQEVMKPLMKYVDICFGNEEDASNIFGYDLDKSNVTKGYLDIPQYQKILQQMKQDFGFLYVISTLRTSISASDNKWSALIYDGQTFYQSKTYDIRIVDRVGGGDSFVAGFIHQYLKTKDMKSALDFATAASALKHTIPGDANLVNIEEVESLLLGDTSGRVKR